MPQWLEYLKPPVRGIFRDIVGSSSYSHTRPVLERARDMTEWSQDQSVLRQRERGQRVEVLGAREVWSH